MNTQLVGFGVRSRRRPGTWVRSDPVVRSLWEAREGSPPSRRPRSSRKGGFGRKSRGTRSGRNRLGGHPHPRTRRIPEPDVTQGTLCGSFPARAIAQTINRTDTVRKQNRRSAEEVAHRPTNSMVLSSFRPYAARDSEGDPSRSTDPPGDLVLGAASIFILSSFLFLCSVMFS